MTLFPPDVSPSEPQDHETILPLIEDADSVKIAPSLSARVIVISERAKEALADRFDAAEKTVIRSTSADELTECLIAIKNPLKQILDYFEVLKTLHVQLKTELTNNGYTETARGSDILNQMESVSFLSHQFIENTIATKNCSHPSIRGLLHTIKGSSRSAMSGALSFIAEELKTTSDGANTILEFLCFIESSLENNEKK